MDGLYLLVLGRNRAQPIADLIAWQWHILALDAVPGASLYDRNKIAMKVKYEREKKMEIKIKHLVILPTAGGRSGHSLGNVYKDVVPTGRRFDESVSFASAERFHFALLDRVTHGTVGAAKELKDT